MIYRISYFIGFVTILAATSANVSVEVPTYAAYVSDEEYQ